MVDVKKYIERSFFNKYLDNVAFEIRFPSTVRILNNFLRFQEKINEKYPDFGEEYPFPILPSTDNQFRPPKNLRKIVFKDRNDITEIHLSINSIGIITKDYRNFKDYKRRIDFIIHNFFESFKITTILRIGLRYKNLYYLDEDLDRSLSIIEKKFNPIFNNTLIPLNHLVNQNIAIRRRIHNNIEIMFRSILQQDKKLKKHYYVLDFDAFILGEFPRNQYSKLILELRIVEKQEFLRFVTEDFISEMEFID